MRALTVNEIEEIGGGIPVALPVVFWVVAEKAVVYAAVATAAGFFGQVGVRAADAAIDWVAN
jgi:hypothetical protein